MCYCNHQMHGSIVTITARNSDRQLGTGSQRGTTHLLAGASTICSHTLAWLQNTLLCSAEQLAGTPELQPSNFVQQSPSTIHQRKPKQILGSLHPVVYITYVRPRTQPAQAIQQPSNDLHDGSRVLEAAGHLHRPPAHPVLIIAQHIAPMRQVVHLHRLPGVKVAAGAQLAPLALGGQET